MPLVSIIIPTHNRSTILSQTLESVLSQTFSDFECLIIDDHSTDIDTRLIAADIARKDQRFKAHQLPPMKTGVSAARNFGVNLSQGEFINFLDSDDLLAPNKIETQLNEFFQDPALDMVSCRQIAFKEHSWNFLEQNKFAPPENWLNIIFCPNATTGGLWVTDAPLWRKDALQRIGCWNEQYKVWTDPELNLRALIAGLKIKRLEQILVLCRVGFNEHLTDSIFEAHYASYISGLLNAYRNIKNSGNMTTLRQYSLSDRLYSIVKRRANQIGFASGFIEWFSLSRKFQVPMDRFLLGCVLLTLRRKNLSKFYKKTYAFFIAYRNTLPPALPDLPVEDIIRFSKAVSS